MAIELAKSPEEDLCAAKAETLAQAIKNSARRMESEPFDLLGIRIKCIVRRTNVRGQKMVLVTTWFADGRRVGINALMGKLKKKQ